MVEISSNIDNPVWRRWRRHYKSPPPWSWKKFLLGCLVSVVLADFVSMLLVDPILLNILASIVGAVGFFISIAFSAMSYNCFGIQILRKIIPLGIFVGLVLSCATVKWRFALYEKQFDVIATRFTAGETIDLPLEIGTWEIVMIDNGWSGHGPVILWESVGGSGGCGFVRNSEGDGVNVLSVQPLSVNWAWVSED